MIKINSIKILTTGIALVVASCPQAFAGTAVPCGQEKGDVTSGTSANCWKCGDNCYARLDSNGKMSVQGSGDMYNNIWTGSTFETIWQDRNSDIKSVYIDEGITSIGMASFWNTNVSYVYIPTTMESIGWGAFEDAKKLKSITLPENLLSTSENIVKNSGVDTIYCTSAQMNSGGVCSQSKLNKYQFKGEVLRYEKENDYYVFYDKDGNVDKRYSWDRTLEYNENGDISAQYDSNGRLLKTYSHNPDGSTSIYDANGKLTGLKNAKSITPAQAAALVRKGNHNTVTLTFK